MKFIGVEIYDGVVSQEFPLEEDKPLTEQELWLSNDIGGVVYIIHQMEFIIDMGWGPSMAVNDRANFCTLILGGEEIDGGIFFMEYSYTIPELKKSLVAAVAFIQALKNMSISQISALPKIDWRQPKYFGKKGAIIKYI